MGGGFEVDTDAVRSAASDVTELGTTVTYAERLVSDHMQIDAGGNVLAALSGEFSSIRSDLGSAYGSGGEAEQLFSGAGAALRAIAADYDRTDAAQAKKYDAKIEDLGETASPWTGNKRGVSYTDYFSKYAYPSDDAFEDFNEFEDISDGVDYLIECDWVGDALGGLGLPSPFAWVVKDLDGDWSTVGRALGALKLLSSYWYSVCSDLDGVIKGLDGRWSGHAANSARSWLDEFEDKLGDHAKALNKSLQRIKAEAFTLRSAVTSMVTVAEKIMELIPNPTDLGDVFGSVVDMFSNVAGKIMSYIELFKVAFDLALAAGFGIVSIFAQLTRFYDTDFPQVPDWAAPDVSGAGR